MALKLFEHNEEGYKCLTEMLKDNKCAVINHATGTGKSFIVLKYLAEHADKKAIFLAPTYQILDQLVERDTKILGLNSEDLNVDTMIYRTLLKFDMKELFSKYDVFIFDEYHRTGAEKTNQKLKELKKLLDKNNDKKFIGLTATPIRYLDNARNMTTELFDGNVASTKTLVEAIIEGLLPAPTYITSGASLYSEYNEALRKVKYLSFCDTKKSLIKRLDAVKKDVDPEFAYTTLFDKYVKNGEKYIIFCSSLGALKEDIRQSEVWFRHFKNVQRYEVHSLNSREENKEELQKFNNSHEGLSILFAVNILNEGVHVDKVDGVILNRKTTSPIIYLQQIGRALSTSSKNKDIKIFDLVNNFNSHLEIKNIYEDIITAIKQLIIKYPERKNFYNNILDKFKILDFSKEILNELIDIKDSVTKEKIIASKIEYATNLLAKYKKDNRINGMIASFIIKDKEVKKAFNVLFRYEEYVTNEQLEKLNALNILLPTSLTISKEERLSKLDGFDSFYLKKKAEYEANKEKLFNYLKNHAPVLEDLEKHGLADIYLNFLVNGNKSLRAEIRKIVKNYSLTTWEKLLLHFPVKEIEIMKFLKETVENCQKEDIPLYAVKALQRIVVLDEDKYSNMASKLLFKIFDLEKNQIEKSVKIDKNKVERVIEYAKNHENYLEEETYQLLFAELSAAEKTYVIYTVDKIKQQKYYERIKKDNFISTDDFLKHAFEMDETNLIIFYDKVIENIEYYKKIIDKDVTVKQISKDLNELYVQEILIRVILFYNKNKRRPYINSSDSEEVKLAIEFKNIIPGEKNGHGLVLTKGQLHQLNRKLNQYDSLKNGIDSFAKNVRERYENELRKEKKVRYLNGRKVNRIG